MACLITHTHISHLNCHFRRPYEDKAETAPLFPPSTSMSPTAPVTASGTATINRTLLHTQQFTAHTVHSAHSAHSRNGNPRGLANHLNGDSPPPNYDDVHDISLQRHGFFIIIISIFIITTSNFKNFFNDTTMQSILSYFL